MDRDWTEVYCLYLLKKYYQQQRNDRFAQHYAFEQERKLQQIVFDPPFHLPSGYVGIRFFYAGEENSKLLKVHINGKEITNQMPPQTITNYVLMPAGDNYIHFEWQDGKKISKLISIRQNQLCTLVLIPIYETSWKVLLFRDDWLQKGKGPWIRFLHLSPDLSELEWVDHKGQVILENVPYSRASAYQIIPEVEKGFMVRIAGSHRVVETMLPFPIHPNHVITVIAVGRQEQKTFRLLVVWDH